MARAAGSRPLRKPRNRYHHGSLEQALLTAALHIIQQHGVDGLTLRGVGKAVGVSQTALYRHFADKSALLRRVATEGFRKLRIGLIGAWEKGGRGRAGFEAMGEAYVRFALENPSHYRVMFSAALATVDDPELTHEGAGAFQALVDAIAEQQSHGLVRPDPPLQLAHFIWALVHGIAMLAIDGRLPPQANEVAALTRFAIDRIRTGVAPASR
jgi:AcrR family transcriptional regulator